VTAHAPVRAADPAGGPAPGTVIETTALTKRYPGQVIALDELVGNTVAEVLDGLFAQFGELRDRISDEDGTLRRFVNVYLSGEDIRFLDGVATSVPDGAELTILPAVAGG